MSYDYRRLREGYARRILAGEKMVRYQNHHLGMTSIKDPRPTVCEHCGEGREVTLSLVNKDNVYEATSHSTTSGVRTVLVSNDPEDYAWECRSCNMSRIERVTV